MLRRNQNRAGGQTQFPSISGSVAGSASGIVAGRKVDPLVASEFLRVGIELGICSIQGKRPYQEDEFVAKAAMCVDASSGESHMFGLFDGHAGGRCSKFVSTGIVQTLLEDPQIHSNLPQALKRSFHTINDNFLKLAERMRFQDGSTGITVIIREGKYMIANVGDCRAILVCNGKAIQLSKDQKPTNPDEQKRIYALGGHVVNCMGITRVNGVLAVSRAFGNRTLRDVIRPDAEITQRTMSPGDEFLVMASDGLWDVLSNAFVTETCHRLSGESSQRISEELVNQAFIRGSQDNITCHVAKLRNFVASQLSQAEGTHNVHLRDTDSPPNERGPGTLPRKFSEDADDIQGRLAAQKGQSQGPGQDFSGYIFPKANHAGAAAGGHAEQRFMRPSTTSMTDGSSRRLGGGGGAAGTGINVNANNFNSARSQNNRIAQQQQQQYGQNAAGSQMGNAMNTMRNSVNGPSSQLVSGQGGGSSGQLPYGQPLPYGQQPYGQYHHGQPKDINPQAQMGGVFGSAGSGPGTGSGENRFLAAYNSFHKFQEEAGRKSNAAGYGNTATTGLNRPNTGSTSVGAGQGSHAHGRTRIGGGLGFQSISHKETMSGGNAASDQHSIPKPPNRLLHSPITTKAQSNKYTQRVSTANSVSGRPSIKRGF